MKYECQSTVNACLNHYGCIEKDRERAIRASYVIDYA